MTGVPAVGDLVGTGGATVELGERVEPVVAPDVSLEHLGLF